MMLSNILSTGSGKIFNMRLVVDYRCDTGFDTTQSLPSRKSGRSEGFPSSDYVPLAKWARTQSTDEADNEVEDILYEVAMMITAISGTTVFGIQGGGCSHKLVWHRDDANGIWAYLNPRDGLVQFDSLDEAVKHIEKDLQNYPKLKNKHQAFTVDSGTRNKAQVRRLA